MFSLRCTKKLLTSLRVTPDAEPPPPTTILGDWYANSFTVGRHQFVLCISEKTLLPVILPKSGADLLGRLGLALRPVLEGLGIADEVIAEELRQMADGTLAKTASRPLLGSMNDFQIHAGAILGHDESLLQASLLLSQVPCGPLRYGNPADATTVAMMADFSPKPSSEPPRTTKGSGSVTYLRCPPSPTPRSPTAKLVAPNIFQLKVTLEGLNPSIWRRLLVPSNIRLNKLHKLLQEAMGWENTHLHVFVIRDRKIGDIVIDEDAAELGVEDERRITLGDLVGVGQTLQYEYDFGDSWEHQVLVEMELPPNSCFTYPLCIDGANACPPEDCGGPSGYVELLNALHDLGHEEHLDRVRWVGGIFDPAAFDLNRTNRAIWRSSKWVGRKF